MASSSRSPVVLPPIAGSRALARATGELTPVTPSLPHIERRSARAVGLAAAEMPPLPAGWPGWPLAMASTLRARVPPRAKSVGIDTLEVLSPAPARSRADHGATGVIGTPARRTRFFSLRNLGVWLVTLAGAGAGTVCFGHESILAAAALNAMWPR